MPDPMRRLFAILLLVLMPLQSLWAAAAPYCAHEESPKAMHLGHHTHEHQQNQDEGSSKGSPAAHADCHVCHGGTAVVTGPLGSPEQPAMRGHAPPLVAWMPAAPVSPPERPNWARLA
jgi:cytochrome c553